MKKYTFEIYGHSDTYCLVKDVIDFLKKPAYREEVKETIKIVKSEMRMRKIVFKDDRAKKERKVREMEKVLRVLYQCCDKFPDLQKELFGK